MIIEAHREAVIDATLGDLWRLVDDPARLPEWSTFAERAELLDGHGVGRRQRVYGHWRKRESEIDQVVTAYEPERLLEWRHEAERLDGKPAPRFAAETRFSISLDPDDGKTRVVLRFRQHPAGLLRGLVMQVATRPQIAKHLDRSLERLAKAIRS